MNIARLSSVRWLVVAVLTVGSASIHSCLQAPVAPSSSQQSELCWTLENPLPPFPDLSAVWASGSRQVFAVGDAGFATFFDGLSWIVIESGVGEDLRDVWAPSGVNPFDWTNVGLSSSHLLRSV